MFERNVIILITILRLCCPRAFHAIYPEQVHLSLSNCPTEMVVTWVTFSSTKNSFVWYGILNEGLKYRTEGYSRLFVDGGKGKVRRYVHKVILRKLNPHTFYVYRCGSQMGVSQPYIFKVTPEGTNWSPKLIIYGDMGWKGAAILPYVQRQARVYDLDAIVHVGDMAYNMDTYDGRVGDEFMRMIEPIAGCIPYMTVVGNHEQAYNFSHYKYRFSMPGDSEGLFYSFNLGPVHFVVISTEVYFFTQYGHESIISQYNWLQQDLRAASSAENRSVRPWIIVFGHRPLYCSSDTAEDCSFDNNILKCCLLNSHNYGLEPLFHKHKVDMMFFGHMHYYERSYPIYNNKVYNGSYDHPYVNPGASVQIITGAAGMKSGTETASYIRPDRFPFFSSENSYTLLTACNKTHLNLQQVSASRGGEVIDSMWLIKNPPCTPQPKNRSHY